MRYLTRADGFQKRVLLVILIVFLLGPLADLGQGSGSPSIGTDTFKQRRLRLLDSLNDGVALLYSQGEESDVGYRADGNFWYLTGVDEPGAVLLLAPGEIDREVLFLKPRDTEEERWTGVRHALTDSLEKAWGFDQIFRTTRLDYRLRSILKHATQLHLVSPLVRPEQDVPPDMEYYNKARDRIPGLSVRNSSRFLEEMRMVKAPVEIAAIEKAIGVTHRGMSDLLAEVRPGVLEYQLQGTLEESFKSQGAQHAAFPAIIGAGEQSTILHYQRLNRPVQAGQLLLLDVGAEWDRYSADISRTIPVDGRFTPEQAEIYDIVLEAQKAAIAAIKPGVTVREVDETAREVIRKAGYVDDFIHSTSHHLGLDTHDAADYSLPLAPGMVITVEPGIYLPDSGIGIRIEDNVLVTDDGHRVLSARIPRERDAVERWITEARR